MIGRSMPKRSRMRRSGQTLMIVSSSLSGRLLGPRKVHQDIEKGSSRQGSRRDAERPAETFGTARHPGKEGGGQRRTRDLADTVECREKAHEPGRLMRPQTPGFLHGEETDGGDEHTHQDTTDDEAGKRG